MVYKFRVTLSGIKGFFRVYQMGGNYSLYDFHKQMRADMEFPQDQLIMFKTLLSDGGVEGRYGLFDLGKGTVDSVSIEKLVKAGVTSMLYFYDVPNKKSVIVTYEGTEDKPACSPVLIDIKGPNPVEFENGYVAFEDLPDSQRHLPGQKPDWAGGDEDDDASDDDKDKDKSKSKSKDKDEDADDDEDEDDEDEEDDSDEDGKEVFDGTEDLNI